MMASTIWRHLPINEFGAFWICDTDRYCDDDAVNIWGRLPIDEFWERKMSGELARKIRWIGGSKKTT
jgi:hypothetical protein